MTTLNRKQILFSIAFIILGFAALQIPLTHLAGSKVSFTIFDAFGPVAGGFLNSIPAVISVFLMQLLNLFAHGGHIQDTGTIIRLFPMIFAALYFNRKAKINVIIPVLAILAFILNPIGRSVWFYSLYWLIPIACYFWQDKFLLARSLGSTFTAHAVGGALWIYFFHLPKSVWMGLIPLIAIERLIFASGIALTYLAFNNVLNFINQQDLLPFQLPVNQQYVWRFI